MEIWVLGALGRTGHAVVAEVAARLARGEGKPGAHTPASALGAEVAEAAGGTFLL